MANGKRGVFALLGVVVLIPILPWILVGVPFETYTGGLLTHFGEASGLPSWLAALAGAGLLAADSFLPVPATLVMSALGYALGWFWGGLVASLGLFLSGAVAYEVCCRFGERLAARIAGAQGVERVRAALGAYGVVLIAATRSIPVLQEACSCLAGLTRMPRRPYLASLVLGCLPTGFAYGAIGASALHDKPLAIALSVLVPVLSWPLVWWLVRRAASDKARRKVEI